ncbi:histidine kinase N-terminal 7TM domain-containing protein [Natrinema sp. LN54]|uniref:histidine kinase N-terminal 7TM domain-containing protein n=1 Tax=Natrinema sp. LN54 TaxID=3458705 RepID=UPI00403594D1
MGWVINPYSVVLLLSLVVAVGTAVAAARSRPAAGSVPLTALMASVALWLGAHVLEIESATFLWKARWADLQWLSAAVIPTLFLVFALEYTGRDRWLTRRRLGLLAIEPAVMVGLLATNDRMRLLWGAPVEATVALDIPWGQPATVVTATPEIGLFTHLGYATLCLAATAIIVLELVVRSNRLHRWQGVAVLIAVAVPWTTAVVASSSLEIIGATPIGLTVTGLAFTVGLYRYRLLEITPIARNEVVANLEDGVLVVDSNRRIVDTNPIARSRFGRDELVGEPVDAVLPVDFEATIDASDRPERSEELTDETGDDVAQFSLADGGDRSYYELSTAPIDDGRGRPIGWTVIVHDVTERVRRERELERKNRKLDEFASVVSHDLRNPLSVSKGYLELLEEEYDPEHVETIADAHEWMERLIDDVLALAREGRAALEMRPIGLGDVATEAWSTVETGGATLSIDDKRTVDADRTQLRQLLENLFRNAVDHGSPARDVRSDGSETCDETLITVTVGTLEDGFYVADSGTGFEGDPAAVFEAGYTTSEHGTGLGLSIVADICADHGWSVTATEAATGGARFEITGVEVSESTPEMTDRPSATPAADRE